MCFLQQLRMNATLVKTRMKTVVAKKKSRAKSPLTTDSYSEDEAAGFAAESVL
jgi:hypothetical protein